jgi:Glycosyltransferase Family 4
LAAVVRELAIRLNSSEMHVEVACLATWGPVADQLREAGVEVTALDAGSAMDWRVLPRFVKLVREHRIDTVFSFLVHANVVAAIGSLFLREVRFIQSIQTTQPNPRWHWKVQAIAAEFAEKVVVPSESVGRVARERSSIPAGMVVVVPNAVDFALFCSTGFQPVPSRVSDAVRHGLKTRATKNLAYDDERLTNFAFSSTGISY